MSKEKRPLKYRLAEKLCRCMDWKDVWKVWSCPLSIEKLEQLIKRLEG